MTENQASRLGERGAGERQRLTLERVVSPWHSLPVRMAAFVSFLYLAMRLAEMHVVAPSRGALAGAIALELLFSMGIVYYACRIRAALSAELGALMVFVALWVLFSFVFTGLGEGARISQMAAQICLLYAAAFFGQLLARAVSGPSILLPLAVVAALFDVAYLLGGPTGRLLETAPDLYVRLSVGMGGFAGEAPARVVGMGVGDVLLLAVLIAAVQRFGLNARGTFWWAFPLALTGLLVAAGGWPVPGVVPIVVGFVLANAGSFRFTRQEKQAMLYAGVILCLVLPLLLVAFSVVGR
ncbi:MAG: hypothetical protein ACE5R4_16995 [Armatimonadota bacterium]